MKFDGSKGLVLLMDCSTIHVTRSDLELLEYANMPVIAYPNEYGAFVYTYPEYHDWPSKVKEILDAGFSIFFADALVLAVKKGCTWIKFDADGFLHNELEQLTEEWK